MPDGVPDWMAFRAGWHSGFERKAFGMGLLRFITHGFINFFGITQPTAKQERQATLFICGLLLLIVVMAGLVFAVLVLGVRQ
jgi:hypothetical protein